MPFLLIRNDITKVSADAIVNPANRQLLEGSGTSRAIYLAAGEKLLTEACRKIGHCDPGQAVATEAFHLSARYIIHAVGPVWKDGHHGEDRLLYSAYSASMKLAVSLHLESIAFPLLSSGNYGYPKDQALRVAISAISDFLIDHELTVYMVLYDRKALAVSR
ncbi:MAG: macro domain-containing protein, partial [Blautia sp.]|nr:macro domain-containing protein [Blautia sp.]